MAIIERIQRLKHPGTLSDFRWHSEMANFGRYNSIYGWNGSGKTIISRLLRAIEMRTPVDFDVVLRINGRDFSGSDFDQINTQVRVFNRDYVQKNVFPVSGDDMAPILVLGEDNVEKQKVVERLKNLHAKAEDRLHHAEVKKDNATGVLDQHCVDRGRAIKDTLRSSGKSRYNNYNKSNYRRRADEMQSNDNATRYRLSDGDREKYLDLHHRPTPKAKINEIVHKLPDVSMHAKEVSRLLETTVVSSAIQSLKEDDTLSTWVYKGLHLHRERNSDRCLFCEQPLPEDRLLQMEAHFNAEYERFLNSLDDQIDRLERTLREAENVPLPLETAFDDQHSEQYKAASRELMEASKTVGDFLRSLVNNLRQKKGRPFRRFALDGYVPVVPTDVVERVNRVVRAHNRACDKFETRIKQARQSLEDDLVQGSIEEYRRLLRDASRENSAVAQASKEVERIVESITLLEREIVEHRRPADELNEDLQRYLGHRELQLSVKKTGYEIVRDGASAQDLSEGECTAIALLYFLKSLQDRNFSLSRGVVVLDDPVSSLDSNALYLAFGFIRQRTQAAAQLFILTHNFTLFRNVKNWFHHMKGQRRTDVNRKPARFYMLECRFNGSHRSSILCPLDPLLEQYDSEYHYLFSRIYSEAHRTSAASLEENYILPNMARRLLEGFLAFRQPQIAGELWRKLEVIDFNQAAKFRILRFVHAFSHADSIGEPEHDPSLLAESRPVLRDILNIMEHLDADHFEAMVELTQGSVQNADSAQ